MRKMCSCVCRQLSSRAGALLSSPPRRHCHTASAHDGDATSMTGSSVAPQGGAAVPLAAPRSCAIAAQPYQTLAGPALSMTFEYDVRLHAFQQRPFSDAAVPSMYMHSLLEHLAEFAESPRTMSRNRNHPVRAAPMDNFWRRVGSLTTVYCTVHRDSLVRKEGRPVNRSCLPVLHPATGSIELVSSTHRGSGLLDVRSTLHDAQHQPLATMVWTGSDVDAPGGLTRVESAESMEEAAAAQTRDKLLDSNGHLLPAAEGFLDAEGVLVQPPEATTADGPCISPPRVLRLKDGGIIALGRFSAQLGRGVGMRQEKEHTSAAPPWLVLDLIDTFCTCLVGSLPIVEGKTPTCVLASYHHSQDGDFDLWDPSGVEIVAAAPKVYASYTMPPWKHRVGLPMLRGEPCIALHIELRQHARMVSSGVYYFTTASQS